MNLKRIVTALLVLLLLGGALVACSKPAPAPTPAPKPTVAPAPAPAAKSGFIPPKEDRSGWPKEVSILGASSGSTSYVISAGWTELIKKYVGIRATAEVSGGAGANARLLSQKKAEFGHVAADASYFAYRGLDEFQGKPLTNLRVIGREYSNVAQVYTKKASGIKELKDIKGRSYMWKQAGSPANMILGQSILDHFGWVDGKDVRSAPSTGGSGVSKAIGDGSVDVGQSWATGASHIVELATMHEIVFLPVGKEILDRMRAKSTSFVPGVIEAGTYRGVDKDIPTASNPAWYTTYAELPDDFVYALTKSLWDHLDELRTYHPVAKEFSIQANLDGSPVPYHPGAIAYLKEKGVWDAKMDALQQKLLSEAGK